MPYDLDDTIVAISSPPGGALRGIVRLSGPEAAACVEAVFTPRDAGVLRDLARASVLEGSVCLQPTSAWLPCALYLWPDGRSYTGQPVAEFHTLGSPPLLDALVAACCKAGARAARPGEFTLRAFLAGRLDLAQAEAVLGVIQADEPGELDAALGQLAGGLSTPLNRLRERLLELACQLEAGLDFADEDLDLLGPAELVETLADACRAVEALAEQLRGRRRAGPVARVALVGWTNAGKSSLFNALVRDAGALVSDVPGTTRDYLTAELDLDGVACVLIDTAGVEVSSGTATPTALARCGSPEVEVLCLDGARAVNPWEREQLARDRSGRIVVRTKADLGRAGLALPEALDTSSATGQGVAALRGRLRKAVLGASGSRDVVPATAARSGEALREAAAALGRALAQATRGAGDELVAADVRLALARLGEITGAVYTDDVLDRVFSRFCLGK